MDTILETILRRHLWVLDLLVLGAIALVAAHATSLAAGAALLRAGEGESVSMPAPEQAPAQPDDRGEAIVRRNIFCSSCRSRPSVVEDEARAPALSLRLLAIMYAPPPADPRQSLAVIKDQRGATGAYVVGSLLDTATIEAIEEVRVSLRLSDGRRQLLTLIDRPLREEPVAPADPLVAELDAGIKKIDENHYDVRRATVESLLGKMDGLPAQARLEPDVREGKAIGFRLRDVKDGGVFAKIGLRDGDLIASVNGLATNGPDNALAIYTSLRSVGHLSVALERAGRRVVTEYDIE